MSPRIQYASFMVRLWRFSDPGRADLPARWQSEMEHIQSGKAWTFGALEELEAFLRQQAVEPQGWAWIEMQEEDL